MASASLPTRRDTIYKWMSTVGCFMMLLPFGQTFYWGNMYIYCKSYLSHYTGMAPTDQAPWMLSVKIGATGVSSLLCGLLIRHVGKRPLLLCGMLFTSATYFLTYFAIQKSNFLMILSFGMLYGMADGCIFIVGIQIVVDWAGSKDGTFIGIARVGMYVGAIATNYFVTWYVNPENKVPDKRLGPIVYFSQIDILDKVPSIFLILGSICTCFQIVGFALLRIKQPDQCNELSVKFESYGTCEAAESVKEIKPCKEEEASPPKTPPLPSLSSSQSPVKHRANETARDVKPKEMLRMPSFYTLCFTFIASTITYISINSYYKEFGQLWITDDFYLTQIGTIIPVITIFSGISWGVILDRFGVNNFLIFFNAWLSVIGAVYCFTPKISIGFFSFCTVIYGASVCPLYSIYNGIMAKHCGKSHFGANQGILYVPSILVCLSVPPVLDVFIGRFGWNVFFLSPAFISFIALIVTIATRF